jgi:polysaccharide biosynthesis transport protein
MLGWRVPMNMMNKETAFDSKKAAPKGLADLLGVTALMVMMRRRLWLITIAGLVAAIVAFAFLMLRTPTYSATALLIVNPRTEASAAGAAPVGGQATGIESEIELLRSPALMNELAASIGLQNSGETMTEDMVNDLSDAITVRQRGETYVVEIIARSADPQRAQLIANSYADLYVSNQFDVQSGVDSASVAQRLAELREDVQAKESAAEVARAESGATNDTAMVQDQIASLQAQVRSAQADLAEREARARQIQQMRNGGASPEAIANSFNSPTLATLRDRAADIGRRQNDLETRYLPNHPAVQAVRAERVDNDAQIQREIERLTGSANDDVSRARARLQSLQAQLRSSVADYRPSNAGGANSSARLNDLEQAATESREIYDSYLERYRTFTDQSQLSGSAARLLSHAALPTSPSDPQLRIALALALGLGLLLGFGAGGVAELLDKSVKNADDLEAKVGHPAIASIPTISKRMMRQMPPAERHPSGYLVGRPMSAFTEALRVLRTVIVYSKLDFSVKVVAVTSALPDEGKTTISMCLARVAAMSGQKVCVVDCDLRKQSINDVIDIETDVGILQVLAGEAPWRSAIVNDPNSDAHVLPVAASGFTPRDVFGSDAMGRLINDLRQHYDLVILDCAPILAVAETRILVAQADTTVLIARAGRTPIGAMRAAVQQTEAANGKVLGIALNYVVPRWQSYTDSLYFDQSKSYYSVS